MGQWNPQQYLQFRNERTRPSLDLTSRIQLKNPKSILDIGCGPGNSTEILHQCWPEAEITGLDSSPEMILKAKQDFPEGQWVCANLESFRPGRTWDLVCSSATLQWVPDHGVVLPQLLDLANEGGALAVQVPANSESPLHRAFQEVALRPRWRERTAAASQLLNYRPAVYYYDLLSGRCKSLDLWETTYYHVLQSHTALIDWYRSTAMRPCLSQLASDRERHEFEQEVLESCRAGFPVQPDGRILYPFKRLFLIAYR